MPWNRTDATPWWGEDRRQPFFVGSSVAASTLDLQPAIRSKTPSTHAPQHRLRRKTKRQLSQRSLGKNCISDSHPRISLATTIGLGRAPATRSEPDSAPPSPASARPRSSPASNEWRCRRANKLAAPGQARTGPFGSVSDTLQGFDGQTATEASPSAATNAHAPSFFSPLTLPLISFPCFSFPSNPAPESGSYDFHAGSKKKRNYYYLDNAARPGAARPASALTGRGRNKTS